jgi:hypothetical protein
MHDQQNQLVSQLQINKSKILLESVFITKLIDVIKKFNLRNIQDFIAFESDEIFIPQNFLIKIGDTEKNNGTNNKNNEKKNFNHNQAHNEVSITNTLNKNKIFKNLETIDEDSLKANQLVNYTVNLIIHKREDLKYDSELLQTQLFKNYQ